VREEQPIYIPKMTGVQYEKKVKEYLRRHANHLVIQRLKSNEPLTALDLKGLEAVLTEIGADEGETLLSDLLTRNSAPSLAHFIRSLVGLDHAAAKAAFAQFLNDRSLTAPQIRFIELIIDQLTARGVMDAEALYLPPFTNLHSGGPDLLFAGKENLIEAVFTTLKSLEPRVQKVQAMVG
jgi:type I restriction enzyme R subunit